MHGCIKFIAPHTIMVYETFSLSLYTGFTPGFPPSNGSVTVSPFPQDLDQLHRRKSFQGKL